MTSDQASIAICPPYVFLPQVSEDLRESGIRWGSQNLSQYDEGAFTGEVSASMLKAFGCDYTIVGHSERRSLFGESDADVAAKFVAGAVCQTDPNPLCWRELTTTGFGRLLWSGLSSKLSRLLTWPALMHC